VQLQAAEKLLRAVLEKSPYRAVRGQACLALAGFLRRKATLARAVGLPHKPEDTRWVEKIYGAEEWKRLRSADPAKLEAEAERLYERVLAEFADVYPDRMRDPLGKQAQAALFEMRELAVGKFAPEIEGGYLDGKPLRLSDQRGKVVVLTFWATWCGPCRAMIPQEKELVNRLKGQPFVLLGVNGDEDGEHLRKWLKDNPLPWQSWRDGRKGKEGGQGRIAGAWNVSAWPTVYVLDHCGTIRYRDVFGKDLDDAVTVLLKEATAGK
jgi:thiol-disulfide isomerase/thioredoxin